MLDDDLSYGKEPSSPSYAGGSGHSSKESRLIPVLLGQSPLISMAFPCPGGTLTKFLLITQLRQILFDYTTLVQLCWWPIFGIMSSFIWIWEVNTGHVNCPFGYLYWDCDPSYRKEPNSPPYDRGSGCSSKTKGLMPMFLWSVPSDHLWLFPCPSGAWTSCQLWHYADGLPHSGKTLWITQLWQKVIVYSNLEKS